MFLKKEDLEYMRYKQKKWYRVILDGSYYDDMVGTLEFESDRTMLIEFKMNDVLGGVQRVMFFKNQLEYDGTY